MKQKQGKSKYLEHHRDEKSSKVSYCYENIVSWMTFVTMCSQSKLILNSLTCLFHLMYTDLSMFFLDEGTEKLSSSGKKNYRSDDGIHPLDAGITVLVANQSPFQTIMLSCILIPRSLFGI